jgi:hypothetical protein
MAYRFEDPAAPTLEEATFALLMANKWRERFQESEAAARYQMERADKLEAELAARRLEVPA